MLPLPRLHQHFLFTIALITGISSISRVVIADTETLSNVLPVNQVARYSLIRPHPTSGQQDLLAFAVPIRLPNDIVTVGGALEWVIKDSGYRLAASSHLTTDVKDMLRLSLPKAHRQFQALPLRDVISLLVGSAFVLVHDPVHRLLAFERCRATYRDGNKTMPSQKIRRSHSWKSS